MTTITKKELVEHAPKDHFDAEQWQRVYTDYAGGDFLFRRGVELAEKISFEVSMPGELWLDVGCGTGYLAARFNQSGRAVMGVDHDPAMIDSAKRRYINKCPTDKLNFITADAYHLPFDDATVDGVMATSLAVYLFRISFSEKFIEFFARAVLPL